jgi:Xaa-Pro aminopeptidase
MKPKLCTSRRLRRMSAEDQALLIIGDTVRNTAAYHLSRFLAQDPVICLQAGGVTHLAVPPMEYGRAQNQAAVDEIVGFDELGLRELAEEFGSDNFQVLAAVAVRLLKRLGIDSVVVPPDLGTSFADGIRAHGVEVMPNAQAFAELRLVKTDEEISFIEETQRAVEAACAHALNILEESSVSQEGSLRWHGEILTSETLRFEIDADLLRRGCAAEGTIVACGPQATDPHEVGHGPLKAGEPIVLDIYPFNQKSRSYADMTRTVVKGEPSEEVRLMYDAVLRSQKAALGMVRPGVNGREVHREVSQVIKEAGYKTLLHDRKPGERLDEGFIHSTGHGIGLEVHEAPRISPADEQLKTGEVMTIEPGIYLPGVGGVRIEDLVVVTRDGHRNLTHFPKQLEI